MTRGGIKTGLGLGRLARYFTGNQRLEREGNQKSLARQKPDDTSNVEQPPDDEEERWGYEKSQNLAKPLKKGGKTRRRKNSKNSKSRRRRRN